MIGRIEIHVKFYQKGTTRSKCGKQPSAPWSWIPTWVRPLWDSLKSRSVSADLTFDLFLYFIVLPFFVKPPPSNWSRGNRYNSVVTVFPQITGQICVRGCERMMVNSWNLSRRFSRSSVAARVETWKTNNAFKGSSLFLFKRFRFPTLWIVSRPACKHDMCSTISYEIDLIEYKIVAIDHTLIMSVLFPNVDT